MIKLGCLAINLGMSFLIMEAGASQFPQTRRLFKLCQLRGHTARCASDNNDSSEQFIHWCPHVSYKTVNIIHLNCPHSPSIFF